MPLLDLTPKTKKSPKYEVISLGMFEDYYDFLEYCREISALGNPEGLWNLLIKEEEMKIFFFA